MAAIASDPLVQQLQFSALTACLEAANNGQLESPPEEWMTFPEWLVPNNLPESNDFEITGLIGRPKESKELQKFLLNPRISSLAVIAPGGVGKTALTLDVLEKACKTPDFRNVFDGVIFVSLKLEKLTASGIVRIDAPTSISQIERGLIRDIPIVLGQEGDEYSFEELKEKFGNRRLLLFVDNLETLLRDDPSDFNEL